MSDPRAMLNAATAAAQRAKAEETARGALEAERAQEKAKDADAFASAMKEFAATFVACAAVVPVEQVFDLTWTRKRGKGHWSGFPPSYYGGVMEDECNRRPLFQGWSFRVGSESGDTSYAPTIHTWRTDSNEERVASWTLNLLTVTTDRHVLLTTRVLEPVPSTAKRLAEWSPTARWGLLVGTSTSALRYETQSRLGYCGVEAVDKMVIVSHQDLMPYPRSWWPMDTPRAVKLADELESSALADKLLESLLSRVVSGAMTYLDAHGGQWS
jgi:hypothetical protein